MRERGEERAIERERAGERESIPVTKSGLVNKIVPGGLDRK